MKIAFIGQKGIPSINGGVERYVEELATRVANLGHEVLVYTRPHYTPKTLTSWHNMQLISLPTLHTKHLDAIIHTILASIDVAFRKVDVVHFQAIGPSLVCWLPKLLNPNIKIVATLQSRDYEHQKWNAFAKNMLRLGEWLMCQCADEVLVVSRPMKNYVLNKYGIDAYFVPNGGNICQPEGESLIQQWGLARGAYIVYIGRLVRHKGVSYLLDAYNQLQTDHKLVIVGDGAFTDKYVAELKAKAKHNPNIIFTGNQTGQTLAQLYDNAAVFVQPSESEGLSLALLEAMGRGQCVLVSNILENVEAVAEAGFVFESRNIHDLAGKLQVLLENPTLAKQKGQLAQQRIAQHYNWDNIAKKVVEVYNKTTTEQVPRKSVLAYLKSLIKA